MQKYVKTHQCKSFRSRQELSDGYLLAKIGVDTAENEPLKVWREIQFIIHSSPYPGGVGVAAGRNEPAAYDAVPSCLPLPHLLRGP